MTAAQKATHMLSLNERCVWASSGKSSVSSPFACSQQTQTMNNSIAHKWMMYHVRGIHCRTAAARPTGCMLWQTHHALLRHACMMGTYGEHTVPSIAQLHNCHACTLYQCTLYQAPSAGRHLTRRTSSNTRLLTPATCVLECAHSSTRTAHTKVPPHLQDPKAPPPDTHAPTTPT